MDGSAAEGVPSRQQEQRRQQQQQQQGVPFLHIGFLTYKDGASRAPGIPCRSIFPGRAIRRAGERLAAAAAAAPAPAATAAIAAGAAAASPPRKRLCCTSCCLSVEARRDGIRGRNGIDLSHDPSGFTLGF